MSTPNPPPRTPGSKVPNLTPEQRTAALAKAAEMRRARADLTADIKHGRVSLTYILDEAEKSDTVGKMKVSDVLAALPGVGKIRTEQIMEKLKIDKAKRLRGLGDNQRKALLAEFRR